MEVVFLGLNDVGKRIYDWLCDREDAHVSALVTTEAQLGLVEELQPELLVSVGFDHLVPREILDVPTEGCLNLHPAYLPYNRGKSPNVWCIVEGTPAGVTLHYMDESFDTGPLVDRRRVETTFADTGRELHTRLEDAQFELFTDNWPDIVAGDVEKHEQQGDGTYHTTDDFRRLCELDPEEEYETQELLNILRALTFPPFNNARIEVDGTEYYVDVNITPVPEAEEDCPDGMLTSY